MYHIVCVAKYRRVIFSASVDGQLKETCLEIGKRYEITFLEIGTDKDHVHFLVQSVPLYSPKRIVQLIKSITAREILRACPEVKQQLWGGEFWTDGYFISTVGQHSTESAIAEYIRNKEQSLSTSNFTRNNSTSSDTPQLAAGRFILKIGAEGFEPPASRSQTERSTRLSYAPKRIGA